MLCQGPLGSKHPCQQENVLCRHCLYLWWQILTTKTVIASFYVEVEEVEATELFFVKKIKRTDKQTSCLNLILKYYNGREDWEPWHTLFHVLHLSLLRFSGEKVKISKLFLTAIVLCKWKVSQFSKNNVWLSQNSLESPFLVLFFSGRVWPDAVLWFDSL